MNDSPRFTEDMAVIGAVRSEFKKAGDSDQEDESEQIHAAVQARFTAIKKEIKKAKKEERGSARDTAISRLERERNTASNRGDSFNAAVAEGVLGRLRPEDDDLEDLPDTPRRKGDKIYSPEPYFADLDPKIYGQSSEEDDLPDTHR